MKDVKVDVKNVQVKASVLSSAEKKLKKELALMSKVVKKGLWEDARASLLLPSDKVIAKRSKRIAQDKLALGPSLLVVCGIGGSNLGTIAVAEAVLGKQYNLKEPKLKVVFADTTDPDKVSDLLGIAEKELRAGRNVIVNGISKSGGTTETIVNFELFVDLVYRYKPNVQEYVVVTTDRNSRLWNLGLEKGFACLEVPKKVGGRYSVLSAVGLFPLAMLGIDVDLLLKGALKMRDKCLGKAVKKNPAMLSAAVIHAHLKAKRNIFNHFLFSTDLESLGRWYRQLMGESVGKEKDISGKKVNAGMTPTVSIGSTDLHSMAQLFYGGPDDKLHAIVSVEKHRSQVKVPKHKEYGKLVPYSQGVSLKKILGAILKGNAAALKKHKRPFLDIILPDKSEFAVGQFLQFKMVEMMFLAALLGVNAFDQPSVESYKVETKKILSR